MKFTRHETGKTRHLRLCYYSLRYGSFPVTNKCPVPLGMDRFQKSQAAYKGDADGEDHDLDKSSSRIGRMFQNMGHLFGRVMGRTGSSGDSDKEAAAPQRASENICLGYGENTPK